MGPVWLLALGGAVAVAARCAGGAGRMSLGAPTDGRGEVGAGMVSCLLA